MDLKRDWKMDLILVEKVQKEELTAALENNHLLEIEVDDIRKDMKVKDEEIKSIHHTSVINVYVLICSISFFCDDTDNNGQSKTSD